MAAQLPGYFANLPFPVRPRGDLGKDLVVLFTDQGHTRPSAELNHIMQFAGNPVISFPTYVGQVTQAALDNRICPLPPIQAGKVIIWQASSDGYDFPADNATIAEQLKADFENTDHPMFGCVPFGDNFRVPDYVVTDYYWCVRGASGTPVPYAEMLAAALEAMDATVMRQLKAAGKLGYQLRQFTDDALKTTMLSEPGNWLPNLDIRLKLAAAVVLAANKFGR